jgi:hypothetical protein
MGPLLALFLAIDPTVARAYLSELHAACEPARAFWHHELCGPVLLVDRSTRAYVTPDAEGTLPANIGLANTAVDWNNQKWTMLLWPLPSDPQQRLALMLHESFHRIQADLGLPMTNPDNPHLDTLEGRYYLQLEYRALAAALQSTADAQRRAIADAIAFRRLRRSLFPNASVTERQLEMNEGLAEYTGVALSGAPIRLALRDLETNATQPTFVRSFAYATGPAYGVLLDQFNKAWRDHLKPTNDLSDLFNLEVLSNPSVDPYDGKALREQEIARDQSRQRRQASLQKLLVEGPVLELPLTNMQMDFDPDNVIPFGARGTVYPTITVRDIWGSIKVTENALLSGDFKKLTVSTTGGWKLDLKPNWKIVKANREGDQTIASRPQ